MDIANALPILHADMKLGLPTFVKVAHWPSEQDTNQLPATAFADTHRKFPVFSKAASFCSALVAAADGCDDRVLNKITDACIGHGIADEVLKYTGLFDTVKRAAAQQKMTHALIIDNAKDYGHSEDVLFLLPVGSQLDVEDSIGELDKSAADNKLPCELIRQAALNLAKAADDHGVKIPTGSVVSRLGQDRLPDYEKAAFLVESRVSSVPAEALDAYREIIGFLKTAGMEQDVIEGLRDLDSQYGVNYGLGKSTGQQTPWEIVFSGPNDNDVVKMASTHVLIADCPIPVEALATVSDKAIEHAFLKEASDLIKRARSEDPATATKTLAQLSETQQVDVLDLILRGPNPGL